jgi:hypothetical protein
VSAARGADMMIEPLSEEMAGFLATAQAYPLHVRPRDARGSAEECL